MSQVSNKGVAFVASFEGFSATPYRDPVGVLTWGFGETRGRPPKRISRKDALALLRRHLDEDYLPAVLNAAKVGGITLNQNELDALVSASYNLGAGIFDRTHDLGRALRAGSRMRTAQALLLYDKATKPNGQVISLPGLTRRRHAERALFLRPSKQTKRDRWAAHLAALRATAKKHGWTKAARVQARALKHLLRR